MNLFTIVHTDIGDRAGRVDQAKKRWKHSVPFSIRQKLVNRASGDVLRIKLLLS